jgi:N-acetylmuramoyl-L-alanine amidase
VRPIAAAIILAACAGPAPASAPPEAAAPAAPELPRRSLRRVVIDAGHGGEDLGATSLGGAHEKDIVLPVARGVAARLRQSGFEVIETRDTDRAVSLAARTSLAEAVGAGIFVSVHANALPGNDVHGVETYYADSSADEASLRLAERENREAALLAAAAPDAAPPDPVLMSLQASAVAARSRALAEAVHGGLIDSLRLPYGDAVVDRKIRRGPFWVLLDAEIPAALVELGYLTHEGDELRLRSRAFQEVAALGIARGVASFIERAEAADARKPP